MTAPASPNLHEANAVLSATHIWPGSIKRGLVSPLRTVKDHNYTILPEDGRAESGEADAPCPPPPVSMILPAERSQPLRARSPAGKTALGRSGFRQGGRDWGSPTRPTDAGGRKPASTARSDVVKRGGARGDRRRPSGRSRGPRTRPAADARPALFRGVEPACRARVCRSRRSRLAPRGPTPAAATWRSRCFAWRSAGETIAPRAVFVAPPSGRLEGLGGVAAARSARPKWGWARISSSLTAGAESVQT